MRKVEISPACLNRLEGAGIKGKCSQPELPLSLEGNPASTPSATVPRVAVQSAPSHPVPQPTSDHGTGRNTQTPAKFSSVQCLALASPWAAGWKRGPGTGKRLSTGESSSGTQAGSAVTLVCQKGTGSQHPQEPCGSQNTFTPAASMPRHGVSLVQSLGEVPSP